MAFEAKVFVCVADPTTEVQLAAKGITATRDGDWIDVLIDGEGAPTAKQLSSELATVAFDWSIDTVVDQIWIVAFDGGRDVRELRFARGEGWTKRGKALPFEAKALKKWLAQRELAASPDGYDVLACFCGRDQPPFERVTEPHSTYTFYVPLPIVTELQAIAAARGVAVSEVLHAAWELGKRPLFEQLVARGEMMEPLEPLADQPESAPISTLPPDQPAPPALAHAAIDIPALDEDELRKHRRIECKLAFPKAALPELFRMNNLFDRPLSHLVCKAYVLVRSQLL